MPSTHPVLRLQPPAARAAGSSNGLLYPLDVLYAQAGIAPPVVKKISPHPRSAAVPRAPRARGRHDADSGAPLRRAHRRSAFCLSALKGQSYFRRVLLVEESSARPVAMGAVRIRLDVLGARNRAKILRQREPLGRILRDGGVDFLSRPTAFFEVRPNAEMMGVFWMPESRTLYGRRTHVTLDGVRIGDIVEILPLV